MLATCLHHCPQYARGDPRNLVLIAHWNSWHIVKIGSIKVQIATMRKADRASTDKVELFPVMHYLTKYHGQLTLSIIP